MPIDSTRSMRRAARTAGGGPTVAIAHLDVLRADSMAIEVRAEPAVLRRMVIALNSAIRDAFRTRVQVTRLATDRLVERKVARDSMANISAELDRMQRQHRAP
jgi:hypothetical protein